MGKKKNKKIDKETLRLIESVTDMVKKKKDESGNEIYKFQKGIKRKQIKQIKRSCPHWILNKKQSLTPLVEQDPTNPSYWVCKLCGHPIPKAFLTPEQYKQASDNYLALIDQAMVYLIKLGGDSDDAKILLKLKENVPKARKILMNMAELDEKIRREKKATEEKSSQFGSYQAYNQINYRG